MRRLAVARPPSPERVSIRGPVRGNGSGIRFLAKAMRHGPCGRLAATPSKKSVAALVVTVSVKGRLRFGGPRQVGSATVCDGPARAERFRSHSLQESNPARR